MKNAIWIFALILLPVYVFPQDTLNFDAIPDTVYAQLDGDTVVFVATDAKEVAEYFIQIYKETKENKPETGKDWIMYIVGLLTTGGLLARLIQFAKVLSQIQAFMAKKNSPTNIAAALSAAIGFGVAAAWPGPFDLSLAISATGIIFTGATIAYINFFKQKKIQLDLE